MLTAKDAIHDRVIGLDSGADDYLVKPFAFAELLARVRTLIRRGRPVEALRLRVADLEMDVVTHQAVRGGEAIDLTAREFELLEYLLRHAGQSITTESSIDFVALTRGARASAAAAALASPSRGGLWKRMAGIWRWRAR